MIKIGDLVQYENSEFIGIIYEHQTRLNLFRVYWFNDGWYYDSWAYQDQICEIMPPPSSKVWISGEKIEKK